MKPLFLLLLSGCLLWSACNKDPEPVTLYSSTFKNNDGWRFFVDGGGETIIGGSELTMASTTPAVSGVTNSVAALYDFSEAAEVIDGHERVCLKLAIKEYFQSSGIEWTGYSGTVRLQFGEWQLMSNPNAGITIVDDTLRLCISLETGNYTANMQTHGFQQDMRFFFEGSRKEVPAYEVELTASRTSTLFTGQDPVIRLDELEIYGY